MRRRGFLRLAAAWVVSLLAACGYGFGRRPAHIPSGATTISIGPFRNQTDSLGVELALVAALEDVIRERGVLRVITGKGGGDLVLKGTIRSFRFSTPVASNSVDRAVAYASVMTLDAELGARGQDQLLWRGDRLVEVRDVAVAAGVVIPSSPEFQRGALNARDVSNLSTIQLAEDRLSQDVLREIVEAMALNIYDQMMEGF